jgi:hypothetical protein
MTRAIQSGLRFICKRLIVNAVATKKIPSGVSEYLSEIGRRGGESKVAKGFSKMDPARRSAIAKKAIATRWANVRKAATKKKAVKKTA